MGVRSSVRLAMYERNECSVCVGAVSAVHSPQNLFNFVIFTWGVSFLLFLPHFDLSFPLVFPFYQFHLYSCNDGLPLLLFPLFLLVTTFLLPFPYHHSSFSILISFHISSSPLLFPYCSFFPFPVFILTISPHSHPICTFPSSPHCPSPCLCLCSPFPSLPHSPLISASRRSIGFRVSQGGGEERRGAHKRERQVCSGTEREHLSAAG